MNINVIRTLTLRSKAEGAQETAAALKSVQSAYDGVAKSAAHTATATDTSAKSSLSVAAALERQQRSLDAAYRSQQQFVKVERELKQARDQGLLTISRHNELLGLARQKYDHAAQGSSAYGKAMQELQSQAAMLSGRLGVLGGVLSGIGPFGLAAGAGITAAVLAIRALGNAAGQLADRAGKMVDLSQSIGFTTTQIQALNKAASQVGVTGDQLETSLGRFAFSFAQLKDGSGELLKGLLEVDAGLAREIGMAKDAAQAWDIYSRARQKANEIDRVKLDRAAFGRGGLGTGRVAGETADAGGLNAMVAAMNKADILLREQLELWDKLKDQSDLFGKTARDNIVSIFAAEALEDQREFNRQFLEFSRAAKEFRISDALKAFFLGSGTSRILGGIFPSLAPKADAGVDLAVSFIEVARSAKNATDMVKGMEAAAQRYRDTAVGVKTANDNVAESMQSIAARGARLISFLGDAATIQERFEQRQKDISSAAEQNKEITSAQVARARAAAEVVRQTEIGTIAIKSQTDALNIEIATIGMSVMEASAYKAVQDRINEAIRTGKPLNDEEIKQLQEKGRVLGIVAQAAALTNLQNRVQFERSTMFLSSTELGIAQEMERIYGKAWPGYMDSNIAQQMRWNSAIKEMKGFLEQGINTFVQGLLQGKSVMESLQATAKQLASTLASSAITDALSGNYVSAAVKGVAAIGAAIFGDDGGAQAQRQQQTAQIQEQRDRIRALRDESRAASLPQGSRQAAFLDLELEARQRREQVKSRQELVLQEQIIQQKLLALTIEWDQKELDQARETEERKAEITRTLSDRLFAAGNNISTQAGALAAFDRQAIQERADLAATGGQDMILLEQVLAAERLSIVQDFAQRALADEQRAADERLRAAEAALAQERQAAEQHQARMQSIADRLFAAQNNTSMQAGALAALDRRANQERADEVARGGADLLRLEQLFDTERFNIIQDFTQRALAEEQRAAAERASAAEAALAQERQAAVEHQARMQSLADRLFAGQTDTTTQEGALAAFDRAANRERLEEAQRGGDDLLRLEQTLDTERFNIIRDFGQRAIDEERRIADERQTALNQAARNIVDYVNSLLAGPESHLSSSARLAAAQSTYDATLALAQGNNIEALSRITQDFENLRKAGQNQFGSGTGYQNILTSGIAQLLALPAVTTSTDPIVNALADVVAALTGSNGVRAAVVAGLDANSIMATRLGLVNGSLGGTTTASAVQSVTEAMAGANGTKLAVDAVTGALTGTGGTKLAVDAVRDALGTSASTGVRGAVVDVHNTLHGTGTTTVFSAVGAVRDAVGTDPTMGVLGAVGTVTTALAGATGAVGGVQGAVTSVNNTLGGTTNQRLMTLSQDLTQGAFSVAGRVDETAARVTTTAGNVSAVATNVNNVNTSVGAVGTNTGQTADNIGDSNTEGMRGLLRAFTDAFGGTASVTGVYGTAPTISGGSGTYQLTGAATVSGSAIDLLRKISFSTAATANNTARIAKPDIGDGVLKLGLFASGGTLGAGNLGIFGEHHPAGPWLMRAGEQPVSITPSMPPSFAANDNGAMLSEVRRLTGVVERQTQVIGSLLSRIAQLEERNVEATERNTAHRNQTSEADRREMRLNARKKTGTG